MKSFSLTISACLSAFYGVILSGCGTVSLPKIPLPKVDIPFVGAPAAPPVNDPAVPFKPQQTLGYGHTLDLEIYAGISSPKRLFRGTVLVDEDGSVDFGKLGKVKVGGMKAAEASRHIGATLRRNRSEGTVNVQLARVEDVSLVTVTGAVHNPGVAPWFEGESIGHVLSYAGGKDNSSKGQAFYITRKGVRHFYGSPDSLLAISTLEAGDIIEFSSDL